MVLKDFDNFITKNESYRKKCGLGGFWMNYLSQAVVNGVMNVRVP
jgi:hypothetical protein